MNLPHKEPLIFAKEVLEKSADRVKVRCEFTSIPSLAMCVEAAAQSCAAFNEDANEQIAFLTQTNDVLALEKIKALSYMFHVYKEIEVGSYKKFSFEVYDLKGEEKVLTGKLTLSLQEA